MKKNKQSHNYYMCKGINNAIALLESNRFEIRKIYILLDGRASKNRKINSLIVKHKIDFLDRDNFYKRYQERKTQGIVIEFSGELTHSFFPSFEGIDNACLLALDQINDPQNFGQIIRTSECAGLDGIIFSKHNSSPVSQTVMQVSQGAFVNLPLYEITNLSQGLQELKKNNFWVIGIENNLSAKVWHKMKYDGKIIIVIGSEGKGIRKKILGMCDFVSTIPMKGKSNSLNVSAAVSAILFERLRQLEAL